MRRLRLFPFLLVIFPVLLSLPLIIYYSRFSQAPRRGLSQEGILFQDDFTNGAANWEYYRQSPGVWEWLASGGAPGGVFHHQYPADGTWGHDNFAYLKDKNFTDFSVESDIKVLVGNAGIQGRVAIANPSNVKPSLGGYRCDLFEGNKIKIQRYLLIQPDGQVGDFKNPLDLKVAGFTWQYGQWYKLKMEAEGNTIRCFVDGVLRAEYTDTNSLTEYEKGQGKTQTGAIFKSGTIGFVTYKANAYWDNVMVKNLGSGGVSPTATPGGRVWTEWKNDDWFGSWKWQGNIRVATQPEDKSLIIHFEGKPFEVIFWDGRDGGTKMPHWRPTGANNLFGVCPVWFESGDSPDWEPLFTDRSLIKLEVLAETNDYVKVRWWYKPTKDRQGSYGGNGLQVHRGNTEVEQIFEFRADGLTQITMNIKLGDQNMANQSGNDMELAEWNFLFPKNATPLSVIGRDGKIVKVMDPYSSAETVMNLAGQGLNKDLANGWEGQIHLLYNKNPQADFFIAWGKKVNPQTSADLYLKTYGLYYLTNGVSMVWPKPSCNISAPLMAKAFYPAANNQVQNYTYKWLVGMGNLQGDLPEADLRTITKNWLDSGELPPSPTSGQPTVTAVPSGNILYFKAKPEGNLAGNFNGAVVSLKAKGIGFEKKWLLPASGESGAVELTGLTPGQTYDFILSSFGFLTAKKTLTVVAGRNPESGFLDFGTLKAGELNLDNQVNGLDWSLMKGNYGETGEE